jgi:hypothetical protein
MKTALSHLLLGGLAVAALSAEPPPKPAPPPAAQPRLDRGKFVVEQPVKQALAAFNQPADPPAADGFVNPKVEPGKVQWHADFAEACRASAKSGKPVLLFQMMGKLDEQFC